MARLGLFILLGLLAGLAESSSFRRAQMQAAQQLLQITQKLAPHQQEDLKTVLPYLKLGDKANFKVHLVSMVKSGGNDRIKKCLQGLATVGYDALEIQAWLQSDIAKVPQSALVESASTEKSVKAEPELQSQAQLQTPSLLRTTAEQAPKLKQETKNAQQPKPVVQQAKKPVQPAQAPVQQQPKQAESHLVTQALRQPVQVQKPQEEARPPKQIVHVLDQPQSQQPVVHPLQMEAPQVTKAPAIALASEDVQGTQKESEKKPQDKAALRKKLAERLSEGVQAKKKVQVLEKKEASVEEEMLSEKRRLDLLEEALKKESLERQKVEEDNTKLRKQLSEEEQKEKTDAARIDALEKADSQDVGSRVSALEDQSVKFRTALAGAARRLINLEATVIEQKPGTAPDFSSRPTKVVRHNKAPAEN